MSMTPEEYAARELHAPGWDNDATLYAPGFNPSEHVPGMPPRNPEQVTMSQDPQVEHAKEMSFEYNFTLPLQLRRMELVAEGAKIGHLSARTRFWRTLSFAVLVTPILFFIALLVK